MFEDLSDGEWILLMIAIILMMFLAIQAVGMLKLLAEAGV
jgi:hypothetical protein